MDKLITEIIEHLNQIAITGKDAERMTLVKKLLREMQSAIRSAESKEADK